MTDLFTGDAIPVEEKVAELRREIKQREFVYPRLVEAKRLTQTKADRRLEVIRAVLADYEQGRVSKGFAQPCANHEYIERDCPDCGKLA